MLLASSISSYHLRVSLFKLFLFSISSLSILLGFSHSKRTNKKWVQWFFGLWCAIIILSVPLFFIPNVGFAVNGMGFQGISNHPQALGIVLVPILAFVIGKIVFEREKTTYLMLCVIILCIIMIILSQARTGFIAMLLGLIFIALFTLSKNKIWVKYWLNPFMRLKYLVLIILLIVLSPFVFNSFQDDILAYLLKNRGNGNISASFYESRGYLLSMQIENIKDNPITGIGFQLATIPKAFNVISDPIFGLPIKASIEKGNIFTAVVEENGFIGAIGFLSFIFAYFGTLIKRNAFAVLWCAMTAFFINIGEAAFFSLSGLGLYIWLMMGLSLNYKTFK